MTLEGLLHYLAYSSIGHIFFIGVSAGWHVFRRVRKHMATERGKYVLQHKRDGHEGRLSDCLHHDCQPLRHL
jgi:hypothetical protein